MKINVFRNCEDTKAEELAKDVAFEINSTINYLKELLNPETNGYSDLNKGLLVDLINLQIQLLNFQSKWIEEN